MTDRHHCFKPFGRSGEAIDSCDENEAGEFWVGNGEYASQVNFCPVCGAKAPVPLSPTPSAPELDRSQPPPGYDVFLRYTNVLDEELYGWEAVGSYYKNPKPYAQALADAWAHYDQVLAATPVSTP